MVYEKEIAFTKTNMNLIPAYASMNEAVFYVLEDNENNFSQMIRSIGLRELAVFESTGSVLLYEADSEESKAVAGEKANFVSKAFANMRAALAHLMEKLDQLVNKVVTALSGAVAKAAAGAAKVATKKKSVDELKGEVMNLSDDFIKSINEKTGFKYELLAGAFAPHVEGKFESDVASPLGKAIANIKGDDGASDDGARSVHSSLNELKEKLGVEEINPASIKEVIRGGKEELTKSNIAYNFENIYKSVMDRKVTNNELKKYLKQVKYLYNAALKNAKKSDNNKESVGELRALVQAVSVIYTAILSEYYAIIFRNAQIVLKVNTLAWKSNKAAKKEEKEAKKEEKEAEKKAGKAEDLETGEKVEAEEVKESAEVTTEAAEEKKEEKEEPKKEEEEVKKESAEDSEIASLFDWSF